MSIAHSWKIRFLPLLIVVLALIFIWFGYVLWKISQVEKAAKPRKADVAIVLGAAVWGEQPSPGLRERLNQALTLYRRGYAPYLLNLGSNFELWFDRLIISQGSAFWGWNRYSVNDYYQYR